jgi:hypothetical protein
MTSVSEISLGGNGFAVRPIALIGREKFLPFSGVGGGNGLTRLYFTESHSQCKMVYVHKDKAFAM